MIERAGRKEDHAKSGKDIEDGCRTDVYSATQIAQDAWKLWWQMHLTSMGFQPMDKRRMMMHL